LVRRAPQMKQFRTACCKRADRLRLRNSDCGFNETRDSPVVRLWQRELNDRGPAAINPQSAIRNRLADLPYRRRASTMTQDKLRREPMGHTRFFRAAILCLALALCAPSSLYAQVRVHMSQVPPPTQYVPDHDYDQ